MVTAEELQLYLGRQIQKLRNQAKLSQEQLAEKIGIATNSLSSIETGNSFMTIKTMEKILNILDVTPKELFDFPEIPSNDIETTQFIAEKLNLIKEDREKLALLYNFVKILA